MIRTTLYVHRGSNHPVNILKQVPKMTSRRLPKLSSNQEEFDRVATEYQEVLRKSDFKEKLTYSPPSRQRRRRRNRKVLYYNSPLTCKLRQTLEGPFCSFWIRTFLHIIVCIRFSTGVRSKLVIAPCQIWPPILNLIIRRSSKIAGNRMYKTEEPAIVNSQKTVPSTEAVCRRQLCTKLM